MSEAATEAAGAITAAEDEAAAAVLAAAEAEASAARALEAAGMLEREVQRQADERIAAHIADHAGAMEVLRGEGLWLRERLAQMELVQAEQALSLTLLIPPPSDPPPPQEPAQEEPSGEPIDPAEESPAPPPPNPDPPVRSRRHRLI